MDQEQTENTVTNTPKKENFAWELIKTILIVGFLVLFIRFFIVQPYYIIGSSMQPDFHNGEYIFVDEASYHFTTPQRGDVIVFKYPEQTCASYVDTNPILKDFFQGPCTNYIKRVIGLPGETVKISNGQVIIINKEHPNGFVLNEKYIQSGISTLGDQTVTVGPDEYFVLGDNRLPNASSDSRVWGLLNKKFIVGKASVILLPVNNARIIARPTY
jgi:signal peptidase I